MEIMKQKLSHGAKMIKLGNQAKIFRKTFGIREGEKVLLASQCYLYTTAGAIAGILFISTERVAFCSDRSIKTYSTTGELLKFQYKVNCRPPRVLAGETNETGHDLPAKETTAWTLNYTSSGPRLIEIMKQKLSHGAKMVQLGSPGKIFKKTFGIREEEKLLQASPCYLYTTAGAIAGILFVSTERVAFCSDRSIKTYSSTGKLLKFQYKR
ncbi:hypothetical protein L2E82_41785 [Cichorium intybus]|uniref:Uncharacterized protein n=1 Tax=Cichorium intybus TaxID=13427 RepID=A0ACB8ZLY3_CICIN|nr:hypothetical protein L2E82_41785 [Cichorium intybus]